ncbi:MAG: dUTP diphosphatase [Actinomycetota bacterium]|nr:dUTP diphosphatase [Actinomycetota bacterium]
MANNYTVGFKPLREGVSPPTYGHPGDGAVDLVTAEEVLLNPFERRAIPLGYALEIPSDLVALVLPRSGFSLNTSIILPNAPGLIDPTYKGEIAVIVANIHPTAIHKIEAGTRIAQMLFLPRIDVSFAVTETLSTSTRGEGGFGSTGYR